MTVIKASSVNKNFGEIQALKGIDLEVEKSEIFGVIGPDGAGKTTLFRIIASLLLPDSGQLIVNGYDVERDFREIRSIIGYMAGRFSLYHDLTVEENLNFYATVFGTSVKDNYELIRDIYHQIEPFKKRRAGALSGGMKQKLALSCALIHKPQVLILDEPTTGVDAVSRDEFWEMLDKLRHHEITIIVSTPYMDEASRCDRVALIQKGEILSLSKPAEISSGFKDYLFAIRSENGNYSLLRELREKNWCKSAWLFGQDIHLSIKREELPEFQKEIESLPGYKSHEKIMPDIEDTFIELMNN